MATILVVDDEPDIRALVQLNLELDGHRVITASNGAEALELIADEVPDVMLLDLMMPEVDGFEFLQRMRGDEKWLDVPVVVLTAKELTESERTFLAERTILVLSKDAQPIGSLGAALSAIARRRAGRVHEARPQ